jgi:hypothetical protein
MISERAFARRGQSAAFLGLYTHSHGSESNHENGKRERAPALMRGIADRDESRPAGFEYYQRAGRLAEARG